MTDLRDSKGEESNKSSDKVDWQFVYRMFTVDNLAGFEQKKEFTSAIRFARTIKFTYLINNEEEDKIYLPYITVSYLEKAVIEG